jgi:hypothetical protein
MVNSVIAVFSAAYYTVVSAPMVGCLSTQNAHKLPLHDPPKNNLNKKMTFFTLTIRVGDVVCC